MSIWSKVKMAPPDKILGITEMFLKDEHPQKLNLGVGAYRDDSGKPVILDSVREAEKRVQGMNHEYVLFLFHYVFVITMLFFIDMLLLTAFSHS